MMSDPRDTRNSKIPSLSGFDTKSTHIDWYFVEGDYYGMANVADSGFKANLI